MNYVNNRFLLQKRPTGMPEDDCWIMDSEEITELKDQEILIKAEYLSIDPYMRGKMNDSISYTPPLKIGEVMVGESVGRVIESKSKNYAVGNLVTVHQGWQTYIRTKDSDPSILKVPESKLNSSVFLGTLGMPGRTAYFGLNYVGKPQPGENPCSVCSIRSSWRCSWTTWETYGLQSYWNCWWTRKIKIRY